jgi:rhomboid protease GluP
VILLSFVAAAFILPLVFYSPEPDSLRDVVAETAFERIGSVIGTLAIGIALIVIAAVTFDAHGFGITPRMEQIVGLNPNSVIKQGRYYQVLTSALVHINVIHLVGNLLTLALLSVYERRVGYRRFVAVFVVAALISSLTDLILLPDGVVSMGASGGICGLAAGYFLDHEEVTKTDWVKGLAVVLILVAIYSFAAMITTEKQVGSVNWVAHLWGALGGALYIRVFTRASVPKTS